MKKKILTIQGTTASGKSKLAIDLAKELDGEIVSADSRQVYAELNIAVAKPTKEELSEVPHHLMDVASITKEYSVDSFIIDAKKAIENILKKGKLPIVVGGTGYYIKSLLGDVELPKIEPNPNLRKELEPQNSIDLHKLLVLLDFEAGQKIHPNNKSKIIRAIEVIKTLNKPRAEALKPKEKEFETIDIVLNATDRQLLYDKIDIRVLKMMNDGLLEEAKDLFKKYPDNNILLNTIGYKEFLPYFHFEKSLEECIKTIQQHTRNYAKRQLTWLRGYPHLNWLNLDETSYEEIKNRTKLFLT